MKVAHKDLIARLTQWWQRQSYSDVILALGIWAITIIGTHFASQNQPGDQGLDAVAFLLLTANAAALVVRRRYPAAVLVLVTGITFLYVVLGYHAGPIYLVLIVAFFTAVIKNRRYIAWFVLAVGFASFTWLPYILGNEAAPTSTELIATAGWLLLWTAAAEIVRLQMQRSAQAQRAREEEARRRINEERLRIARDLHDVLGHHISLISVQAGVALHLIDEKPEQAQVALTVIRDASKEALRELRSVLDVLRQADEEEAPKAPTPGLAALGELIARASDAGLQVKTEVIGDLKGLPASVDSAAFRIIQEALTNVIRHSGQTRSTVQVARTEQELTLQIDNEVSKGIPREGIGLGQGILGMKERATALGGSVEAGPHNGGFQVLARLPLDDHALADASVREEA